MPHPWHPREKWPHHIRHKHEWSLFIKVAHDGLRLSSNTPEGWNRKLIPLDMNFKTEELPNWFLFDNYGYNIKLSKEKPKALVFQRVHTSATWLFASFQRKLHYSAICPCWGRISSVPSAEEWQYPNAHSLRQPSHSTSSPPPPPAFWRRKS